METCPTCHRDVDSSFEYCHYCGTPTRSTPTRASGRSDLVPGSLGDLRAAFGHTVESAVGLGETVDRFLGDAASARRQVAYALLASLAVLLFAANPPTPGNIVSWIEAWLLCSLLLLVFVSYWMTGVMPFVGALNMVLGDEMSVRRRAMFALALTLGLFALGGVTSRYMPIRLASESSAFELFYWVGAKMIGSFLVAFYFMGHAANWRAVRGYESWLYLEEMAAKATDAARMLGERLKSNHIHDLAVTETSMAQLRHVTAGGTSGTRGSQVVFTRGRARIVLFVQDFGDALFLRWTGYYDLSGRRLLLIVGAFVSFANSVWMRFTGTSFPELWRRVSLAMSPRSRHQVLFDVDTGSRFWMALGLVEAASEYARNELRALECAVGDAVVEVTQALSDEHREEGEIRRQIRSNSDLEGRSDEGPSAPALGARAYAS